MSPFIEKLNKLIESKGFTNYRIAKCLNISQSTIANYRDGTTSPTLDFLEQLSKLLGVSDDYFLSGTYSVPIEDIDEKKSIPPANQKIAQYLKDHMITQQQAAETLEVSQPYINAVLTGKKGVHYEFLQKFCNKYGLPTSYFSENENTYEKPKAISDKYEKVLDILIQKEDEIKEMKEKNKELEEEYKINQRLIADLRETLRNYEKYKAMVEDLEKERRIK